MKYFEKNAKKKVKLDEIIETGAGAKLTQHQYRRGHLTGRETLWHVTPNKNVSSILEQGLDPSKSKGGGNFPGSLSDIPNEKLKNKVYFARKRRVARSVGKSFKKGIIMEEFIDKPINFKNLIDYIKKRKIKILKSRAPT